jgi:hypothetical protein
MSLRRSTRSVLIEYGWSSGPRPFIYPNRLVTDVEDRPRRSASNNPGARGERWPAWALLLRYLTREKHGDFRLTPEGFHQAGNAYLLAPVKYFGGIIEKAPVTAPYDDREDLSRVRRVKVRKVGCPFVRLAKVALATVP